MDDEDFQRERRNERRFERMGTRTPRCPCCGETSPECFEEHHIAGRRYDQDTTIFVSATCHLKLTELQKSHPMFDPNADPFLQSLAHFLLGLADMLELAMRKLREFAHALLHRARQDGSVTGEAK